MQEALRAAPALAPAGFSVTRQHTERSSWAASSLTKCTAGCRPGKPVTKTDRASVPTTSTPLEANRSTSLLWTIADLPSRSI